MALPAKRNSEDRVTPQTDNDDGPILDPNEVLDRLEPVDSDDIDKAPRGIVYGTVLGAAVWAVIYAIYELAL